MHCSEKRPQGPGMCGGPPGGARCLMHVEASAMTSAFEQKLRCEVSPQGARRQGSNPSPTEELRVREGQAGVRKCWPAVQSVASALGLTGQWTIIDSQPHPGSLVPWQWGAVVKLWFQV